MNIDIRKAAFYLAIAASLYIFSSELDAFTTKQWLFAGVFLQIIMLLKLHGHDKDHAHLGLMIKKLQQERNHDA